MGRRRRRADGEGAARPPAPRLPGQPVREALRARRGLDGGPLPRPSDDPVPPAARDARVAVGRLGCWSLALVRHLVRLWARLLFGLRIENPPRLRGGFVVVANHASQLDPLVLGSALPRRSVFLMTVLHFRSPWLGWFYRWQRAIPLELRSANRDALRAARDVLAAGVPVVLFPEAGMSRDGELLLGSPGAVSLVFAADVPVVPAFIDGAARAWPLGRLPRPHRVRVRFGAPIAHAELLGDAADVDRRSRHQRATRILMDRIAALGGVESREAWLERRGAARGPSASIVS